MLKLTIIIAFAIGSMAFVHSDKVIRTEIISINNHNNKPIITEESHRKLNNNQLYLASADQGQKGGKGNKGGSGKQGGSVKHKSNDTHGQGMVKQHSKDSRSQNHQIGEKGNRSKSYNSIQPGKRKPSKGHSSKNNYYKGHPNFGYIYKNKHGHIGYRNYGQWRSEQARKKHKKYHPVYEYEAIEGFQLIIGRNVFLYSETEYKIDLLRVRLAEKRKVGRISVVEYDTTLRRVAVLEQRRAELNINIAL